MDTGVTIMVVLTSYYQVRFVQVFLLYPAHPSPRLRYYVYRHQDSITRAL